MSELLTFSKLAIDKIKKNDLKQIFEILMILPANRTIADLNTLSKIVLNIQPIKQIKNLSTIYHCCKSMYLAKFKEKDFVFQKKDDSQALYIVLSGKVGLYKRSTEEYEAQEVIFMEEGCFFGKLFNWKVKFLPLVLQETLIAILPKRELNKIGIVVNVQKELIMNEIRNAGLIPPYLNQELFRSISHNFVINRVPHGQYLLKSGETPKVIFLILKGMVKKVIQIEKQAQKQQKDIRARCFHTDYDSYCVTHYSTGDYFPKSNMNVPANYNLIAECPSEIVTIPKKALKSIGYNFTQDKAQQAKDSDFYKNELQKQRNWQQFKKQIVNETLKNSKANEKLRFR